MGETWTKGQFWAELDALDEDEVRVRIATRFYSDVNEKGSFAREWIQRRELATSAAAERRREASSAEQIEVARSAKDAAWAAARAAESANKRATAALAMAAISIIISIIGLLLGK